MRKIVSAALAAGFVFCLSASFVSAQTIDGTRDASYGGHVSVQTVNTQFGDNQSEWNAAYACLDATHLSLMFTGNLEANFNKLEIFIDSSSAVTSNVLTTVGNDGAGVMDGMTFDTGFAPDYHLIARRGMDGGAGKFDLDFADLGASSFTSDIDIFGGTLEGSGLGANTGIEVGYDNSNTAGIGSGTGAADTAAALAVTTGLELKISLADLGNPTGPINVMLLQNNQGHDFLSNQTLGGLEAGTDNLGNFGVPSDIDFNNFTGDQFFTVNPKVIPEPATAGLLVLASAGLIRRRR